MAYNITSRVNETADGEVAFPDGNKLCFKYRPNAYTPNHEDIVEEARVSNKGGDMLKAMLIPLLVSWDAVYEVARRDAEGAIVVDKKTKEILYNSVPVPITHDGLGMVPFEILNMVMRVINEGVTPGEAKDTESSGSFG